MTSPELRWLYVDFNSYFASVEQQLRPELRGKPVAVVPVETDSTCAIAVSYEAKAYGIKTGTPVHEAKRLCKDLICVLAQHDRYVEFHHRILEEVERHVHISMVCSIDEVACRLMNNENSPERATEIAHAVKRGLAEHVGEYVRCSIGIAPNRYLAKVATDLKKPDGLTFIHAHELPDKLSALKLRDLPGIGRNMDARIQQAGITSVTDLYRYDAKQLRKIWGNIWGEKMWYFLRGVELPDEVTKRSTIGHSHVMAPELRPPEKARYVARRLLLKAASRLRRLEHYASALSLSIRTEEGQRFHASAECWRAQDSPTFLHMLDTLWAEATRGSAQARIKKVSVTLHNLTAAEMLQPELFGELPDIDLRAHQKAERMSRALDAINHRFGRDSVSMGILPSQGRTFSGSKIAFTRIPDIEEFLE